MSMADTQEQSSSHKASIERIEKYTYVIYGAGVFGVFAVLLWAESAELTAFAGRVKLGFDLQA